MDLKNIKTLFQKINNMKILKKNTIVNFIKNNYLQIIYITLISLFAYVFFINLLFFFIMDNFPNINIQNNIVNNEGLHILIFVPLMLFSMLSLYWREKELVKKGYKYLFLFMYIYILLYIIWMIFFRITYYDLFIPFFILLSFINFTNLYFILSGKNLLQSINWYFYIIISWIIIYLGTEIFDIFF